MGYNSEINKNEQLLLNNMQRVLPPQCLHDTTPQAQS